MASKQRYPVIKNSFKESFSVQHLLLMEYFVYSSMGSLNAVHYFRSSVLLEDIYIWCGDLYMLITDAGERKNGDFSIPQTNPVHKNGLVKWKLQF